MKAFVMVLAMLFALSLNMAPVMADSKSSVSRDHGSRDSASKEPHHGDRPEKVKNPTRERLEKAAAKRDRPSSR